MSISTDRQDAEKPGGLPATSADGWRWLHSPRQWRPWTTTLALVLLLVATLVHVDLFLRTLRSQLPLSLALLVNTLVFVAAIVAITTRRASQLGWLAGTGACLGAATAWLSTELFAALSFLDPEGNAWPGHGLLHLLSAHLPHTGQATFAAEMCYLWLWTSTTRSPSPLIAKLRWTILASLILLAGFIVVLALGGGAGKRYGGTG